MPLNPATNSLKSGSTRVWIRTSLPSAEAARSLTERLGSLMAFTKVVCSCGRNGFKTMPT